MKIAVLEREGRVLPQCGESAQVAVVDIDPVSQSVRQTASLTPPPQAVGADASHTNALARLAARGMKDASPGIRVAELAKRNRVPAQQLYEIMTAASGSREQRLGQGRGRGGGTGGGFGRWTLAAFCQEEGIDLETAQQRLEAEGIKASGSLTLREIAASGGYQRPYEILEIIRGNSRNHRNQ